MKYIIKYALPVWAGTGLVIIGYGIDTKEFWIFIIPFITLLTIRDTWG